MTGRDLVKVFCPRNHRIGTVRGDSDGLLIGYSAQVSHTTGLFGADSVDRLPDDVAGQLSGYCKSCRKPVKLDVRVLRAAALDGQREMTAPYVDAEDRAWVEAGHPPMYPPGTPRGKNDPRQ